MNDPSSMVVAVLVATVGITLWGGLVVGPRRLVPVLLVLGPLFLPAYGAIALPGLPDLDRVSAVTLPAAMLLPLSPRECWRRFRLVPADGLLAAFVAWTSVSTTANQGLYAGASMALTQTATMVLPYLIGRLYLQRTSDLVGLARLIAPFVVVYLALMLFEARMYPRFQSWVYGTDPVGLSRFGLYRPVVFAQNALELGHTMVLLTVLLLAVHRGGRRIARAAGPWLQAGLCAAFAAVLLSLSRGPVTGLLLALLLPALLRRPAWCACALGAAGVGFFVWMLSPAGSSVLAGMALADSSTETGQTLFFRFLQVEAFKPMVEASPWLGYGESWDRGGMAIIDGELLLTVLGFGWPGMVLLSGFWLSCTHGLGVRGVPRRRTLQHAAILLTPVLGWLVFGAWGDAFLRAPHMVVMGGLLGAVARPGEARVYRSVRREFRRLVLSYG